uniref:Cannabinoid receptor 2 n=1 Tax=Salvator merianae TaxID=96440 RepID=A0A8D0AVE8_SALMN
MSSVANTTMSISSCSPDSMSLESYIVLNASDQVAITILCGVTGSFCFLENSLVLYLIFSSPKIRNKPSYLLISSLALADTLASIIFVGTFVSFHVFNGSSSTKNLFLVELGGVTTTFTASLGSLLLMAFDRYICILRPSEYKVLVTVRKAVTALVVLWLTILLIAFLPLLGWNCCSLNTECSELFPFVDIRYLSSWIALVMMLLFSIIYAYMHVLWKAHKHVLRMEKHQPQSTQQNKKMRMDVTLAKTLVMILVVLMVCWSPVLALMTYSIFAKLDSCIRKVFAFCSTLCLMNSMVNPAIYALRSRELSSALQRLFSCFGRISGIAESNAETESTRQSCPVETVCDEMVSRSGEDQS